MVNVIKTGQVKGSTRRSIKRIGLKCWKGYVRINGKKAETKGSFRKR